MIKLEMLSGFRPFTQSLKMVLLKEKFNTHTCPTRNCSFTTTIRWNFRRHVDKCTGETVYTHKQKQYGNVENTDMGFLKDNGFIPKTYTPQFAAFDIEACLSETDYPPTKNTIVCAKYELLSIGVVFTDKTEYFLKRESQDDEGLYDLIRRFWNLLKFLQRKIEDNLPTEVSRGLCTIAKILSDEKSKKSMPPTEKASWLRRQRILRNYAKLNIYSWVRII